MTAPRTNTARAMLDELALCLASALVAPDPKGMSAALADAPLLIDTIRANLDSLWDDMTSLQNANLGLATDIRNFTESTAKDLAYIEELERANSALHSQFAEEQQERERLVEQGFLMLGAHSEWFRKLSELRGRGTPRLTLARTSGAAAPFGGVLSVHTIGE